MKSVKAILFLILLAFAVILFSSCEKEEFKNCDCKASIYKDVSTGKDFVIGGLIINPETCEPYEKNFNNMVFVKCKKQGKEY